MFRVEHFHGYRNFWLVQINFFFHPLWLKSWFFDFPLRGQQEGQVPFPLPSILYPGGLVVLRNAMGVGLTLNLGGVIKPRSNLRNILAAQTGCMPRQIHGTRFKRLDLHFQERNKMNSLNFRVLAWPGLTVRPTLASAQPFCYDLQGQNGKLIGPLPSDYPVTTITSSNQKTAYPADSLANLQTTGQ